jgi:cytochrome d ubiquinol oxidase subunit II
LLEHLPLIFILVGLAAYAVLAGADFGAGIWVLLSKSSDGELRDHARHSMGPVWEANHVWLIFVLVLAWTAYPTAASSITSTLAVPLGLALLGIVMRGTTYALREQAADGAVAVRIERAFGAASILTPFALGAAVGAIACGRVPVGNAAGHLFSSWLNPTGIAIGALSVATAWYLSSVYLAADAQRSGSERLVAAFRARALITGVIAGALALLALIVLREDAGRIWHGLTHGWGLAPLAVSVVAGLTALALVVARRYEPARVAAATAVAAVVAGWAVAQSPELLPGLTLQQAAAGHATLLALAIAVPVGLLILLPSLGLLVTLVLRGRFDPGRSAVPMAREVAPAGAPRPVRLAAAGGCLVLGAGLTVLLDSWGLALGVVLLITFVLLAFAPLSIPPAADPVGEHRDGAYSGAAPPASNELGLV